MKRSLCKKRSKIPSSLHVPDKLVIKLFHNSNYIQESFLESIQSSASIAAPLLSHPSWSVALNTSVSRPITTVAPASIFPSLSGLHHNSYQHSISYSSQSHAASKAPQGAYNQSPGAVRPSSIKIAVVSSNLIAEPFKGDPPRLPFISWFTPSGWKQRWSRWLSSFKSIYALSKVKKHVTGWTLPSFKQEAIDIYRQACAALALGDKTTLKKLCAPAVFTDMKRQIKARLDGGWDKVHWCLSSAPAINQVEVVHARLIAADPKDDSTAFAQLTVRIPSGQTFAAYDTKGRQVAGDPEKEIRVNDHWVFEIPLRQQRSNRWRVAGRLTIMPSNS